MNNNLKLAAKLHKIWKISSPYQLALIKTVYWLLAIILGIIQVWNSRFHLSTGDVVSYLDIGEAYLRGDLSSAVNSYFAPLYPILLATFQKILNPPLYWQFLVVKLTNFFIYLLALVSFEFFLNSFIRYHDQKVASSNQQNIWVIPHWIWTVAGYSLFIWSSIKLIGLDIDSPDMLVAVILYLATALTINIYSQNDSWLNFMLLAIVLALGYLTKSFLFPLSLIFLIVSFISIIKKPRSYPKVVMAIILFLLICSPYIYSISIQKGRLTMGTSGKLNYAWKVSPANTHPFYWQGNPPSSGTPKHSVRKIFTNPTVYEFAQPISGTYPVWYDPSYWNEGLKPTFNFTKQIRKLLEHIQKYYQFFLGGLLFTYLIFASLGKTLKSSLLNSFSNWVFWIPSCAGLGSLMLIHVQTRYISALIVMLYAGLFAGICLPNTRAVRRLTISATLSLILILGNQLADFYVWSPVGEDLHHRSEHLHFKIAHGLTKLNVSAGDQVAILGAYQMGTGYYWAKLSNLKIVAEIPSVKDFWETDEANQQKIYTLLQKLGVRAIVQAPNQESPLTYQSVAGWQLIPNTNTFTHIFSVNSE